MRISSGLLAWGIVSLLLLAGPSPADTVEIVADSFGASDALSVWGGGSYGDGVDAGVYTLNKINDSGIGSTWHNGPKADLRVFMNAGAQNYLVAVPEPATPTLLGLGGLALIRRRRPYH